MPQFHLYLSICTVLFVQFCLYVSICTVLFVKFYLTPRFVPSRPLFSAIPFVVCSRTTLQDNWNIWETTSIHLLAQKTIMIMVQMSFNEEQVVTRTRMRWWWWPWDAGWRWRRLRRLSMKREVTVRSKKILVRALIGSFLPLLHSDANSRALSAPMQSKTSESRRIVVALIFRNSLRVLIISPAGPTQFGSIFFSFRFFDVKNRSPPLLCPDVRHSTNQWKNKY